jgi:hypothetical protein
MQYSMKRLLSGTNSRLSLLQSSAYRRFGGLREGLKRTIQYENCLVEMDFRRESILHSGKEVINLPFIGFHRIYDCV